MYVEGMEDRDIVRGGEEKQLQVGVPGAGTGLNDKKKSKEDTCLWLAGEANRL